MSAIPGLPPIRAGALTRLQLTWIAYGICALPLMAAMNGARELDFRAFYDSALAWREGTSLYVLRSGYPYPNLNPPTFALLIAPLSYLTFFWAFMAMTAIGAVSLATSLWAVAHARKINPEMWPWILGALGALPACQDVWIAGQVTWLLLFPITRAWLSASQWRAGMWLGLAIAIKPPLALAALLLPKRVLIAAGCVSLALSLLALLATGVTAWNDWLALREQVAWLPWITNMSLVGLLSRMSGSLRGPSIDQLSLIMLAVVALVGLVLARSARKTAHDRRWGLALLWSLLVSPAGWVYYLPLALGPMLPQWPRSSTSRLAFLLFAVPAPLVVYLAQWPLGRVLGASTYGIAALLLWTAGVETPSTPGAAGRA